MAIRGSCLCGGVTLEIDREIAAGLFDDDFGIRPDRHIFVDFMPPWDDLHAQLPAYTLRQVYELRRGTTLPEGFVPRTHASAQRQR